LFLIFAWFDVGLPSVLISECLAQSQNLHCIWYQTEREIKQKLAVIDLIELNHRLYLKMHLDHIVDWQNQGCGVGQFWKWLRLIGTEKVCAIRHACFLHLLIGFRYINDQYRNFSELPTLYFIHKTFAANKRSNQII
jgi:hypothetical protein